jgi:hypothetical protein
MPSVWIRTCFQNPQNLFFTTKAPSSPRESFIFKSKAWALSSLVSWYLPQHYLIGTGPPLGVCGKRDFEMPARKL